MSQDWIDEALERGIPPGELSLAYQPVVHLSDHRVSGGEALIRWRHLQKGLVPAGAWMPAAAASGALSEIATALLPECAQFAAELNGPVLSFNVSGQQLNDERHMAALLATPEHRAKSLAVEIHQLQFCIDEAHHFQWWPWETVPDLEAKLERLRRRGMAVWIDDFGEGSSDERTICHALADVVKLDISLLKANQEALTRLVRRIHEQDKLAIIEGVETEAQRALVQAAGVDMGQGFLFAPPLERDAFATYVAASE